MADRITQISARGLRTLRDTTIHLDGLTVLIGENGVGKSAIIELVELLRNLGEGNASLIHALYNQHGGPQSLFRHGVAELSIGIRIEGDSPPVQYSVTIAGSHAGFSYLRESLNYGPTEGNSTPLKIIDRTPASQRVFDRSRNQLVEVSGYDRSALLLGELTVLNQHLAATRLLAALRGMQVQVPLPLMPGWASRTLGQNNGMRSPRTIQPTSSVELGGGNLANAFHALRSNYSEKHWHETMSLVRLGLGRRVESVYADAEPSGGSVSIKLKIEGQVEKIPAFALSDGQLAYLAIVAMHRLGEGRSLVAFDEPDLHLHPALMARAVNMFEEMAQQHPVVLTTHSDRLLDALSTPDKSVILCELDSDNALTLLQPNKSVLEQWLQNYSGIGAVRAAGFLPMVMTEKEPNASP